MCNIVRYICRYRKLCVLLIVIQIGIFPAIWYNFTVSFSLPMNYSKQLISVISIFVGWLMWPCKCVKKNTRYFLFQYRPSNMEIVESLKVSVSLWHFLYYSQFIRSSSYLIVRKLNNIIAIISIVCYGTPVFFALIINDIASFIIIKFIGLWAVFFVIL